MIISPRKTFQYLHKTNQNVKNNYSVKKVCKLVAIETVNLPNRDIPSIVFLTMELFRLVYKEEQHGFSGVKN